MPHGEASPLRLSDLLGAPARRDGETVGRVVDLSIELGGPEPTVRRALVRRGRGDEVLVDVTTLWTGTGAGLAVDVGVGDVDEAAGTGLGARELLLGRHVLDTQIVDVDGRRVVRVGDVLLSGGGHRVVAVDVGFGAVCQRLGLGPLARRLGVRAVPWDALHLTSPRGHRLQLTTSGARLHRLDAHELAFLVDAVGVAHGAEVLAARPDLAAGALGGARTEHAARLLGRLPHHHADRVVAALPDEVADRLASESQRPVPRRRYRRHRRRRYRRGRRSHR